MSMEAAYASMPRTKGPSFKIDKQNQGFGTGFKVFGLGGVP